MTRSRRSAPFATAVAGFPAPIGWSMTVRGFRNFRDVATEAGRDPATLPISMFRVPDDPAKLGFCQGIGINRAVFSLPAEKDDKIPPMVDRWVEVKRVPAD